MLLHLMTEHHSFLYRLFTSFMLAGLLLSLPLQAMQSTVMALQMTPFVGTDLPTSGCENCQPDGSGNDCPLFYYCFMGSALPTDSNRSNLHYAASFLSQASYLYARRPSGPEPPPPRSMSSP